jgi:hypothetical protein
VIGNLFDAGDLETLAQLDGLDERGGLEERLVSAGVEPREASRERLDAELAAGEVLAVDVGDLELTPDQGLEGGGSYGVSQGLKDAIQEARFRGFRKAQGR